MGKHRLTPFRQAKICACASHGFVGLTFGQVSLFDAEDIDTVSVANWSVLGCKGGPYARSGRVRGGLMHRELMADHLGDGDVIDHENHDTLDNRKSNLRVCQQRQNLKYKRAMKRPLPKGVYATRSGKFRADICSDGVRETIGYFPTAHEAGAAYDRRSSELHGEFGCSEQLGYYR